MSLVRERLTSPPFSDEQEPSVRLESGENRSGFGEKTENSSAPRGREINARLEAVVRAARYQGVELDPNEFRAAPGEDLVSAAALSTWAQNNGMWARAVRIGWRHLSRFQDGEPVVLLFTDGSAALLTGANAQQRVVFLTDPTAPEGIAPTAVDELRLREVWSGEAVLIRATRVRTESDAPFSFAWIVGAVAGERRTLIDIGVASFTISLLTIFPPFIVMTVVNRVLQFHSTSTLALLSVTMVVIVLYETVLGYSRRLAVTVISARLDAKLNLHVFTRLLRLPLDYFECNPAGETMYKLGQVHRVPAFLTGKLLTTFLDLVTLCVLLPFLFYINATLAWIVLVCAIAVSLIILAFLGPLKVLYSRITAAESWKSATLGETIVGIRTVKSLALEPQRGVQWDERVAEAGKSQLAF
jgi:ATP-binding cassette subfamily B protein